MIARFSVKHAGKPFSGGYLANKIPVGAIVHYVNYPQFLAFRLPNSILFMEDGDPGWDHVILGLDFGYNAKYQDFPAGSVLTLTQE